MSIGSNIRRCLYWTIDYLNGSPIRCHYKEIKDILNDNEKGVLKQRDLLEKILEHAVINSRFYKDYNGMEFTQFPVMNKTLYKTNHEEIKVDLKLIPGNNQKLHFQKTSGSTGTPMLIPQNISKRNRVIAELKFFGEIAGYKSHEKMGHLRIWNRWANKTKLQTLKENIFAIDCSSMDDDSLNNICNLINKKKIVALLGYASWFTLLARFIEKNNVKLNSIKIIITGSEILPDDTRKTLKELIKCNVVSRYSNEEQGIMGQELIDDELYHLNHASYFFEILKFDRDEKADYGELGRIVVTDLYNYAFPFIRYDTGDTGIMESGPEKGSGFPILSHIFGRRMDLIYNTGKQPVHPMILERTLKYFTSINQWQFIQKTNTSYLLKINGDKKTELQDIITQLKKTLGRDAEIQIEFVNEIPILASGKRRPIICELES